MRQILIASKTCRHALPEPELCARFRAAGMEPVLSPLEHCNRPELFDGVVIGTEPISSAVMDRMPKLSVICKFGVGTDNIGVEAAAERNIAVRNLPGINSESVAQMALALMLASARRIPAGDRLVRSGHWPRLMGVPVAGKKLGILGTGTIGSTLARFAAGLRMELLGWDAVENPEFLSLGGRYLALPELLNQSDFISLHLPLTADTRGILGEAEFALMRPHVTLVNTARGGLVDEEALFRFLERFSDATAGFDVLAHEPPHESPLLQLPNMVVTPHIAAYDKQTLEHMVVACVRVLCEYWNLTDTGIKSC